MENPILKKLLPHGIAFVIMVVLSLMFFSAYVFDGQVLSQHDNIQAAASQSEMDKYKAETGTSPLWTGSYFSGMPTFQIHLDTKGNLTIPVFRVMMFGQSITSPFAEVLLAMLCMYLLLTVMRLDWRIAVIGAGVFWSFDFQHGHHRRGSLDKNGCFGLRSCGNGGCDFSISRAIFGRRRDVRALYGSSNVR